MTVVRILPGASTCTELRLYCKIIVKRNSFFQRYVDTCDIHAKKRDTIVTKKILGKS